MKENQKLSNCFTAIFISASLACALTACSQRRDNASASGEKFSEQTYKLASLQAEAQLLAAVSQAFSWAPGTVELSEAKKRLDEVELLNAKLNTPGDIPDLGTVNEATISQRNLAAALLDRSIRSRDEAVTRGLEKSKMINFYVGRSLRPRLAQQWQESINTLNSICNNPPAVTPS